jgi:Tol biopolymer transport system component
VLQRDIARLWLRDLRSGVSERLTGESTAEWTGLWRPDGREILFTSRRGGPEEIYRVPLHGPRRIEALGTDGGTPQDWTPDGKALLYVQRGLRLWSFEHRTSQLLLDEAIEWARMSPTGRFLAYHAAVDGSMHVYVRPYPDLLSNRWRIPAATAIQPDWSPDGRELYYLENGALMVISVDPASGPAIERPRLLLEGPYADYDVAPDGRFLAIRQPEQPDSSTFDRISVVQNWLAEFEPPSRKP